MQITVFIMMHSGTTALHEELEDVVAKFVGKPAALVTGMGYVTNSAILPVLIGKVCHPLNELKKRRFKASNFSLEHL